VDTKSDLSVYYLQKNASGCCSNSRQAVEEGIIPRNPQLDINEWAGPSLRLYLSPVVLSYDKAHTIFTLEKGVIPLFLALKVSSKTGGTRIPS